MGGSGSGAPRDAHGAATMSDQRADDGLLGAEARVRLARRRSAQHQLQHAANDVQVGGLRTITERTLAAGWDCPRLLEQFFVTLLEVPQFATTKLKLRLHGLAFHQHGLSGFQRDDGVRDALDPRLRSGALTRPRAQTLVDRGGDVPADDRKGILNLQRLSTQFHIGPRVYKAVNEVSLYVNPGECLGVIGESGSGKSVTALSVMGLVPSPPGVVTGGAVRYEGEDLLDMPFEKLRQKRGDNVAYIFQDPLSTLHPLYRVGDQLKEAISVHHKVSDKELDRRAIELLKSVRIPNPESRIRNYPHEMSGGMRQRVGIAMALANDPEVIIADEPTTALDVTVQAQILSLLDDLRRERGLAIVFITHDFGVVAQLCDRVAVMYGGRIVEEGTTTDILDKPAHPYTARLMACVPELGGGKRELAAIPGLPPIVSDLPPGCAFAPRCDKATEACRQGEIALEGGTHKVRCIHPEEEVA